MQSSIIRLNQQILSQFMQPHQITVEVLDTVSSTNTYLKKYWHAAPHKRVCVAEQQIQGKGRADKGWYSPWGENIYFSLLFPFLGAAHQLSGLSIAVGLSVVRTLQKWVSHGLQLKWPNDILYRQQKIAGILIEIQPATVCQVIIGIGINVNMQHVINPTLISQPWTSLANIIKKNINRNEVIMDLVKILMHDLPCFLHAQLMPFITQWQEVDALKAQQITIQTATQCWQGTAQGIDAQGNLRLQLSDGTLRLFAAGEATLLKNSDLLY